jgi:hypothetical protein
MRPSTAYKAYILAAILFVLAMPVQAGQRPVLGSAPRYNENYAFLADPSQRRDVFDPIKFIRLGEGTESYISFGGEVRARNEGFINNPLFGISPLKSDNYLLHRTLAHADLYINDHFRSFFQLGYHDVYSKSGAVTSTERDKLDLQQGFVEVKFSMGENENLFARIGRQEMPLGSQRLVSVRDGPNIRLSFDAARITYVQGDYNLTGFIAHPVAVKQDMFDDVSDYTQDFWGVYGTLPIASGLKADLYYLGLDRKGARFAQGIEHEKRHSIGTRIFGASSGFDYNFEGVYQFGSFGQGDINAWTVASDTGYSLKNLPYQPRLGLKLNIASGDRNKNDQDLNTFNALFPRGSYFTENALIGPANFIDAQPNITLKPRDDVTLNFGADILWRENTNDAIYRQPNIAIAGTAGRGDKYTGTQGFVVSTWQVDPHLSVTATYVHFAVGDAIESVGGGDSDYIGSWISYRF